MPAMDLQLGRCHPSLRVCPFYAFFGTLKTSPDDAELSDPDVFQEYHKSFPEYEKLNGGFSSLSQVVKG